MPQKPDLPDLPDLKNLTRDETRAALVAMGVEPFRGDQVFRWVHGRGADNAEAMTDLAKPLRARLAEQAQIGRLEVDTVQVSTDGTRKLRLKTADGRYIESVLIPDGDAGCDLDEDEPESESAPASAFDGGRKEARTNALAPGLFPKRPKLTQCISSQVGCALDCTFCATAKLGFGRNLTAGEIVDQVYRARDLMKALLPGDPTLRAGADHVTNIVFMGMGEPLHNLGEVLRALAILSDDHGASFSGRRITVSTAGLVPAIRRFAESPVGARANLAVSLNATTDPVRDELMPINRKYNIQALLSAVREFPLARRRRVTFEYVLLDGINDSLADARRLPDLLADIPAKVNLIPWNPHPLSPAGTFRRPTDRAISAFQSELRARGLAVYVRRSRGRDIDAACGQLAAKAEPEKLIQLRA